MTLLVQAWNTLLEERSAGSPSQARLSLRCYFIFRTTEFRGTMTRTLQQRFILKPGSFSSSWFQFKFVKEYIQKYRITILNILVITIIDSVCYTSNKETIL